MRTRLTGFAGCIALVASCTGAVQSATQPDGSIGASTGDGSVATSTPQGAQPDAGPSEIDAATKPQTIGNCSALGSVGEWQDITPPAILGSVECGNTASCGFGVSAFVLDPANTGTLYVGTADLGIWKTTDCGSTWEHVDTGANAKAMDGGNQWSFAIDQTDPSVLYTCTGYGSMGSGAWKSTNSGVDWQPIWPLKDTADAALAKNFQYNFIGSVSVDPYDHTHILLTFHEGCCTAATCGSANPDYSAVCMVDSHDSGASWTMIHGDSTWIGEEGQSAWFLDSSDHWMWGSSSNGLWQTTDGGKTFKVISTDIESHGGGQLYRAHDGTYYLAGKTGIISAPADALTWTPIPKSGTSMSGLAGDGTTMWASSGYPFNPGQRPPAYQPFMTASESSGQTWSVLSSPPLADGGPLAYDASHHVLYSSNLYGGFYRVVTK